MYKIVNKKILNPTVTLMDIEAPLVAKKAEAGQFIILRVDEKGEPLDFLDVYRIEEEIRQDLEKLSPAEQDKYIARLKGEYTVEILLEDIQALQFRLNAYERVLENYHLLDEANKLMDEWKKHTFVPLQKINDEELPFRERRMS